MITLTPMSKEILEDMQQAPIVGAGGAKAKLEKQARQLAYDTKYKVKQALSAKSGGNADPAAVAKMYLAQLAKSPAPPAIKALAKKKLMGEEYVDVKGFVVDSVTDALLKVFVEKKDETVEEVIEEEKGEQKFHIKVTDKKTGSTYHRYATRAKISELRANSNIATVEMSHQGEAGTRAKKDHDGDGKVESPSKEHAGAVHNAIQKAKGGTPDGQDTRKEEVIPEAKYEAGASTYGKMSIRNKRAVGYGGNAAPPEERMKAHDERMKKHKGMKEEVKIDEGHKNPESVKGIAKELDKAVEMHKSQAKRLRKSGVSEEKEESKVGGGNLKKLTAKAVKRIDADVDGDVDGKDSNKAGFGEFVPSADGKKKIKTKIQKEDYISNWREEIIEGKDKDDTDKDIDVMKGKNKIKVMPELGEECEKCGGDHDTKDHKKEEEDPRGMNTKVNLMRNKLRAMGLKMSHQPEGEMVEQVKTEKKEDEKKSEPSASGPTADEKQMIAKKRQMMLKTQMIQKQKLNLQKQGKLPITSEATEDSLRDRRMERGGVDGNNRYKSATKNVAMGGGKKKPKYDGMSAVEKVKASIRAKHGQGAIIDTKKK